MTYNYIKLIEVIILILSFIRRYLEGRDTEKNAKAGFDPTARASIERDHRCRRKGESVGDMTEYGEGGRADH